MQGVFPWEWAGVGAGVIALAIAIRYPGSRRWIAALAVLVAFGTAAVIALMIGIISRMDVGGELPPAALIASGAFAILGLVLAGVIAFWRRSPRQA